MMPDAEFNAEIEAKIGGIRVVAGLGDLTRVAVDAIVCPSNSFGLMRGGVADTIREMGGNQLERAAIEAAPIPVGGAAATAAGRLPCKWVIHAVTMRNPIEFASKAVVERAVSAALHKANACHVKSVAFPGMGTGTGRLDTATAANAMVNPIRQHASSVPSSSVRVVVLVAWTRPLLEAWIAELTPDQI